MALFNFQTAQAAPGTWANANGGSWGTPGKWRGNTIAAGQNDLADFSTLNITADRVVTLDTTRTIGQLKFGDATTPSHNWTLNANVGSVLTLKNVGSGTPVASITVDNQLTQIDLVVDTQTTETIQKLGLGTLALTGANTIGANSVTQINAGTLLANNTSGSATGAGSVIVGASGRLGGSGTITSRASIPTAISVSGVLAPGASVGSIGNLTLNMGSTTGVATMNPGSSFQYELGTAGLNFGSVGLSDMLTINGAGIGDFILNGNNINFQNTGAVGFYKLFDTDNANTWSGLTFDGTTGDVTTGLTFTNLTGGLTGKLRFGTDTNGGTKGDIYLQVSSQVIPEPTTALLGGIGLLVLLRRRRGV